MQQRFLLKILLLAQHVSGTTMPIIRSSRLLYSGCCLWYFVLWFSSCWSGVELRVMCPVCRMLQHSTNRTHSPQLHTSVASSWHFISTYFLPCIWQMKAPFPTQKVSYNDRHQNDFLVILQFPQCFPYQTSWKEPTLARMYPWSVTQRHTPHPSTTGQRKEGIWSSRVSEMTISHELGNANGKLRDVFLRK